MFHFPQPGERANPSGIPISDEDAYWLLLACGKVLTWAGESTDTGTPLNNALLAWWDVMNALPRDLAILCQMTIRDACDGQLPAAPWEDIDQQGNPI